MTPESKELALHAMSDAAAATINLVNALAFPTLNEEMEIEEALSCLLQATAKVMEAAGFQPDETERGQLYRAIANYIGEERLLGDASGSEESP